MQRYETNISIMPYQWRQPVETQNFASPEEKTQQQQAYPYPNSLRLVACETQDFALVSQEKINS